MADCDDDRCIGRRYLRQDELGTLYCMTVDSEPLKAAPLRSATGTPRNSVASPPSAFRTLCYEGLDPGHYRGNRVRPRAASGARSATAPYLQSPASRK